MRRVALAVATVPSARIALARCDNATELSEFYSFCDIVRQPLRRQKRMTIFAICLHNDCKRKENGDACIACPAEKIITIAGRLHRQDDPVYLGAALCAHRETCTKTTTFLLSPICVTPR